LKQAVDALLQRKWQQLHLPASGSAVKSKEGESQWSSFFYSLFDKVDAAQDFYMERKISPCFCREDLRRRVA
jgi:hypothetical protein